MTDHKKEALSWLKNAADESNVGGCEEVIEHSYRASQIHATMYLAEQQRIANLIALATPQETFDGGTVCLPSWIYREVLDDDGGPIVGAHELRPEIRAALGLDG